MQVQQLYNELKKVRHELNNKSEEVEDLREELREMTQMYLITKQEKEKYKSQIDSIKGDLKNIDKIIQDNVDKAVKNKEKQFIEINQKVKASQDKILELEQHNKCYQETISYLEDQLNKTKEELSKEKELNEGKENLFINHNLYDEKMMLKQLQHEDEEFCRQRKDDIDQLENLRTGNIGDKDVTSTNGDMEEDFSLEDATGCRLKNESSNSSQFQMNQNCVIKTSEVKIEMRSEKEESKTMIKQSKTDFMLSQESIKQLEEEAEIETKEEREKLETLDKQKRELAKTLREEQDKEFKQKQDQTKSDRLKYLLKQSEIFAHFILQKQKGDVDESSIKKALTSDKKKEVGGKQSVSKRHQKKTKQNIEDDAEIASDQVLTRLSTQPSILKGGQLRDYQLDGLNWLIGLYETGINGILADEMGLGKTIQTISLIAFLREFKHVKGYHLVIVPKSTLPNWMKEFKKWCPVVRVVNLIARKEEREEILKNQLQPGKFDVCLTTYEGCRICLSALLKFKWEYTIVDEAHKIKNEESQISQKLRQLDSRFRLLLTGTPLQNNLHELWSLLNFLLPEVFTSSEDFDEWFDLGSKNAEMTDEEREKRNTEIVQQLHKILRPFLLRRIKKEVEKSLAPKVEIHVNVGITEQQKSIYRQLLKKSTIEKGTSVSFYRNIIVQLRKVCDHPYLFDGQEPDGAEEFGEHLITSCGKMLFLDKLLKKVYKDKNQVLLFSGFTSMLDILEDYCLFRKYNYCRLDGNTELDDREKYIEEFTSPNSDKFIFLISTRAGGLGLNLMTANIVVLYDSDWNPQIDLQAMDRAHRIGQTKVVQVFRLITTNTMEEKMIEKQTMKLKLDSLIIQKGRLAPKHQGFQKDELQDMVNYGADAIFKAGSDIQDEDIELMIKKGEEKSNQIQKRAEFVLKDKFNMLDFEMNAMNMYQFEDVDYLQEKRKEQQQALKKHVVELLNEEVRTGRREKKMASLNLNESKLFPKFFQGGNIGISNETKKKKLLKVQDFRFFQNPERLKHLLEKELNAKYTSYLQGVEQVYFTEEEKKEKDELWSKGFVNWDRRDYQRFCQALELFSKDDYQSIAEHVGTKTPEEIKQYSDVFFQKLDTLGDSEKIKKNIEKAERMLSFKQKAPEVIKAKVMAYEYPLDEMVIYSTQKSKYFSKESDIILLCLTNKFGYGKWRDIKKAIRRDPRYRYDHLFLSRNEAELQRRVDILVRALEKEEQSSKKKENGQGQEGEQDMDEGIDDMNFDEEGTEEFKTVSKRKPKKSRKFSDEKDVTISDETESVALKQENDEESKFNHLKDEAQLRVGGNGQTYSEDELEEEEKKINPENENKAKKQSSNATKKLKNSNEALKQTKLQWGSKEPEQILGVKREQPEEQENREESETPSKKQKSE